MKLVWIVHLMVVLTAVASETSEKEKTVTAYLTLIWPDHFCDTLKSQSSSLETQCDEDKLDFWDHQSFTIESFIFYPRQSKQEQQAESATNSTLSFLQIIESEKELRRQMLRYIPCFYLKGNLTNIYWEWMWNNSQYKHHTTLKHQSKAYQVQYFSEAISLYRALHPKMLKAEFTEQQLADTFGVEKENLIFGFSQDYFFHFVIICYHYQNGVYQLTPCNYEQNIQPNKKFKLKNWKILQKAIDVYDWEAAKKLESFDFHPYKNHLIFGAVILIVPALWGWFRKTKEEQEEEHLRND